MTGRNAVATPPVAAASQEVTEAARAKVNLYLHVTGRRADGYHRLDSLAVFPPVGDTITARSTPGAGLSLSVIGRFAPALAGEADNLVLRAARALAGEAGIAADASLQLDKRLPVASGIGGGSADAAATLRALARLWRVSVPAALAARLGADVPVCLHGRPTQMTGVGEILTDIPPLPACGMVLLNPEIAVATQAVFAARAGAFSPKASYPARWDRLADFVEWLSRHANDLEAPAVGICPAIATALALLRRADGCALARMSGSGATCFGLFTTAAQARHAARTTPNGWWAWGGAMQGEWAA